MSKGSSKGKLCGEFQTNSLSSPYVEITYSYYFRGYVMFHGKQKLTSRGAKGLVHVNRGIFQGDSLSPLIFVICMIALSLLLRKVKASYEWGRKEFKLNHLLFIDDFKLFRKSVNQIDGVFKFDGIHLPNQEIMEEIDENGYTNLENLELDEIKEHEMKIKATAE